MANKTQKSKMPGIEVKRNKSGEVISYKFRCCVGRDEQYKQIWRTATISTTDSRIEGLTPAALVKKLNSIKADWDEQQKVEYDRSHAKEDKAKISFADFVHNRWWTDHVMDGSHTPTSISFYKYMSEDIVSYFGKKKLASIDAEAVKRYIRFLNTEAKTKAGDPLSSTTIVRHYQTLRNILNYAIRFGYLHDDPCKTLTIKDKPQKETKGIDFLKPKDAQRFIEALENEPLYWKTMLNVLLTTGLRRGEAVGLQWGDIDADALSISVKRNVSVDHNSPDKLHIGAPKTEESIRTVPITPRVYSMLMDLRKDQESKYNASFLPSAYVFCRDCDPYLPCYPTEPTRYVRKFIKRNHLPNVSPHDLRHTAATLALESGADLKQVQELLGHKDPATTMQFYAGVTDEGKRRTVEGIESLLRQKA